MAAGAWAAARTSGTRRQDWGHQHQARYHPMFTENDDSSFVFRMIRSRAMHHDLKDVN